MTVKFIYAKGETASKLGKQLSAHKRRIELKEQIIGTAPHVVFSIPEKPERTKVIEVNEQNAIRLALSSEAKEVFQLNRLDTSTANDNLAREYKVIIMNLTPLKVWTRDASSGPDNKSKWVVIRSDA
ncbi:MAG: hypothetical protein ACM3UW_06080, partial [Bacillota bacterium]